MKSEKEILAVTQSYTFLEINRLECTYINRGVRKHNSVSVKASPITFALWLGLSIACDLIGE